jgi:hypothetical protein
MRQLKPSNFVLSHFGSCLIACSFLVGAVSSFGQSYDRPPYSRGSEDPARRDRELFDRTRADLDRAGAYPYSSRADRKRFDEAKHELFDFESRFDQGRYERHELDEAIDRIQHVVSHNSLDPHDRGALDEDLRRMRDYREVRSRAGNWR